MSPDLAPCAIAAALTRATGCPPARAGAYRAYSGPELAAALAELSRSPRPAPPPPADPLAVIWWAAAQRLLPSTRMLLSHQAELVELRGSGRELRALVAVVPSWLPMVEARRQLIADALTEALARPVAVALQGVAQ